MNINMFRDADNDAGFWAAAAALDPSSLWGAARVWHSSDAGASYSQLVDILNESTMGFTTAALGNFLGGNIVDELNSVNVALRHGTLSSTTTDGLLAGVNACVIGEEIVYFRAATLEANGTYTLRGLLRGRRGSEYAMSAHAAAERFVLLTVATLVRVPQVTADIGQTRLYKPVSGGAILANTTAQSFTNAGTGLKPYAVSHLGAGRNTAGDVIAGWIRRGRLSGEWRDGVDVPLSEATEAYEAEVWTAGFAALKRTFTGLASPTLTYTAAQQTTDFGSLQAAVPMKVYQMSVIVGRGHVASGVV